MKVQIGEYKIDLDDFIRAVFENTENEFIIFDIKDCEYEARIKFKVNKSKLIKHKEKYGT